MSQLSASRRGYAQAVSDKVTLYADVASFDNINDVLECQLAMDSFDKFNAETSRTRSTLACKNAIGKYMEMINSNNFCSTYESVNRQYQSWFWCVVQKYNVYKKISFSIINNILDRAPGQIVNILYCNKLVGYYDKELGEFLQNYRGSANLLLAKSRNSSNSGVKLFCFPASLTINNKEDIISSYIDSTEANPNDLRAISLLTKKDELSISDKTRLKAKKRLEEKLTAILNSDKNAIKKSYHLEITNISSDLPLECRRDAWNIEFKYNIKWLEQSLNDNAMLLLNFAYVFYLTDFSFQQQAVFHPAQVSIFSRLGFPKEDEYLINEPFASRNNVAQISMYLYYSYLRDKEISLESLIDWFFSEYLPSEFDVCGFLVQMPAPNYTFRDRCKCICSELESSLKQFELYRRDGEIDHDLLAISSDQLDYQTIPSLLKNKYAFGIDGPFRRAARLLFSDQSMLFYVERITKVYSNFAELIQAENITKKDYSEQEHDVEDLAWLIEEGFIISDLDGRLSVANVNSINLLYQLYWEDTIPVYHLTELKQKILSEFAKRGYVKYSSTLLTKEEQDYFSYVLNKKKFSNSMDLRNSYLHGSFAGKSETECEKDYYVLLRLFVVSILKINDELCIFKDQQDLT